VDRRATFRAAWKKAHTWRTPGPKTAPGRTRARIAGYPARPIVRGAAPTIHVLWWFALFPELALGSLECLEVRGLHATISILLNVATGSACGRCWASPGYGMSTASRLRRQTHSGGDRGVTPSSPLTFARVRSRLLLVLLLGLHPLLSGLVERWLIKAGLGHWR